MATTNPLDHQAALPHAESETPSLAKETDGTDERVEVANSQRDLHSSEKQGLGEQEPAQVYEAKV